jgi:hypothetical protein
MPKKRASKRVPAEIKAFLSGYDSTVQEIALRARALVLDLAPDAVEQIDLPAKMLAYGSKATYRDLICVIMPQKGYVNFGLPRGAELPDPTKLLTGTGKRARHVKLTDARQTDNPSLRALVRASIEQLGKNPSSPQ